ncbi:MAG: hypothetical protein NDJ90_03645 [Oligoflexia bacterium]|nr:hypothetical protein [Oligoflexia bacterium]
MPNHLHILVEGRGREARVRLALTMRWLSRRYFAGRNVWEAIPEPEAVRDEKHLLRQIRYIHLNPCRAGLTTDPLGWDWSTHRDWTGFVAEAWPDLDKVRRVLRWSEKNFAHRFHSYVSSDPTVRVTGSELISIPIEWDLNARLASAALIQRAVECAYRSPPGSASLRGPLRATAMEFMLRNSASSASKVARAFGVARQSAWEIRRERNRSASKRSADAVIHRILRDDRILFTRGHGKSLRSENRPL